MANGHRAGLQLAKEISADAKRLKAEQRRQLANDKDTGKDAETVIRDRRGRPLTMLNSIQNGGRGVSEEQYEWGTGKAKTTTADEDEQKRYEEAEKSKPMSRYAYDADLNSRQAQQQRWGDPMAEMLEVSILQFASLRTTELLTLSFLF